MRGKDIKKAISYHMKRNQVLLDPRQKHMLAAVQVRLNYLQILGDLKMYNGKIFNATLMLQDRESYVALLVGAKHGVSQIINSKLSIITSLAEFTNISRVELTEESEKVSMVKIYLQDLKGMNLEPAAILKTPGKWIPPQSTARAHLQHTAAPILHVRRSWESFRAWKRTAQSPRLEGITNGMGATVQQTARLMLLIQPTQRAEGLRRAAQVTQWTHWKKMSWKPALPPGQSFSTSTHPLCMR